MRTQGDYAHFPSWILSLQKQLGMDEFCSGLSESWISLTRFRRDNPVKFCACCASLVFIGHTLPASIISCGILLGAILWPLSMHPMTCAYMRRLLLIASHWSKLSTSADNHESHVCQKSQCPSPPLNSCSAPMQTKDQSEHESVIKNEMTVLPKADRDIPTQTFLRDTYIITKGSNQESEAFSPDIGSATGNSEDVEMFEMGRRLKKNHNHTCQQITVHDGGVTALPSFEYSLYSSGYASTAPGTITGSPNPEEQSLESTDVQCQGSLMVKPPDDERLQKMSPYTQITALVANIGHKAEGDYLFSKHVQELHLEECRTATIKQEKPAIEPEFVNKPRPLSCSSFDVPLLTQGVNVSAMINSALWEVMEASEVSIDLRSQADPITESCCSGLVPQNDQKNERLESKEETEVSIEILRTQNGLHKQLETTQSEELEQEQELEGFELLDRAELLELEHEMVLSGQVYPPVTPSTFFSHLLG
uniref:RETREG1-3/ARL6IP-like N-terminal reticulon-homology domain-containing protein n=1 Tax=Eptatretus burgeri TaxID=7764 RepID=A0A8C4QQL0_EPTBU